MNKFKVGQRVIVSSVEGAVPWGRPTRELGYIFTISKICKSIPSGTPLYYDQGDVVAAEPNLTLAYTLPHTRILK